MAKSSWISALRSLPSAHRRDLRRLGLHSAGYLLTLLLPSRLDRWAVGWLLRSPLGVRDASVRRIMGRLQQVLGPDLPDADFEAIARDHCGMTREIEWMRFRAYHTRRIPVETSVEGLDRVQDAQRTGKGVILWGTTFCETLPVKVALWRAGVPLIHLSTRFHGAPPPPTRFGLTVVGPFYCAAENPFLAERVIIPEGESLGYMRVLMDRLAGNGCVYIRGDYPSRRKNVIAPLFGRDVPFAPGAPGLSWRMGAPLLPIHVVRDGPYRYRAVIHPPIEADRGFGKERFIRGTVDQFARLVERCALESPSSWGMPAVLRHRS